MGQASEGRISPEVGKEFRRGRLDGRSFDCAFRDEDAKAPLRMTASAID